MDDEFENCDIIKEEYELYFEEYDEDDYDMEVIIEKE